MKKQKSQVGISQKNTIADAQLAKAVARRIATGMDGGASALECMELETESGWQVTTCQVNPVTRNCETVIRECNIQRTSPLTVTVEIRYDKVNIEARYLAEGWIDGKEFLAKVTAYGRWENDWYVWDKTNPNGSPEAPYAKIYISEL